MAGATFFSDVFLYGGKISAANWRESAGNFYKAREERERKLVLLGGNDLRLGREYCVCGKEKLPCLRLSLSVYILSQV